MVKLYKICVAYIKCKQMKENILTTKCTSPHINGPLNTEEYFCRLCQILSSQHYLVCMYAWVGLRDMLDSRKMGKNTIKVEDISLVAY